MTHHQDDIIRSGKDFASHASELLDSEIQQAMEVIVDVQNRYKTKPNTVANLNALRDEALTRLAAIGIRATLDPSPCFRGEPPVLEILGRMDSDRIHLVDHERKGWEVRRSIIRREDYLGQRERPNKRKK